MTNYLATRDGGKTNEEGRMRIFSKLAGDNNTGRIATGDFSPAENGTPNMTVLLAAGDLLIPYTGYIYHGWSDISQNVTVDTSDPSNPRVDRLVAYVDLAIVSSTNANNPAALVFKCVAGTAAASPVAPSDSAVQTSVGAGNPWIEICEVAVGTSVTTILDANITDNRGSFTVGGGGALPPFSVVGSLVVANALTPNWIVPPNVNEINRIDAVVKVAPTGAALNLRLYNITQAAEVGTVSIAAGATTGSNTTITNPTLTLSDVIRLDCTQIGSTIAGSDVTVQPSR